MSKSLFKASNQHTVLLTKCGSCCVLLLSLAQCAFLFISFLLLTLGCLELEIAHMASFAKSLTYTHEHGSPWQAWLTIPHPSY